MPILIERLGRLVEQSVVGFLHTSSLAQFNLKIGFGFCPYRSHSGLEQATACTAQ